MHHITVTKIPLLVKEDSDVENKQQKENKKAPQMAALEYHLHSSDRVPIQRHLLSFFQVSDW